MVTFKDAIEARKMQFYEAIAEEEDEAGIMNIFMIAASTMAGCMLFGILFGEPGFWLGGIMSGVVGYLFSTTLQMYMKLKWIEQSQAQEKRNRKY